MIKGTALHEILNLPLYWLKVMQINKIAFNEERISYGNHSLQYFLMLKPSGVDTPRKVIVYFHGGGWIFGSPGMFRSNAQVFLEKGYWVFLPTYRRLPRFGFKEIREDVSLAFLKIMEVLRTSGLKNVPLILGGMSAGGNLAALLFYDKSGLKKLGFSQDRFQGLFLCGAPLNLKFMWRSPVLKRYASSEEELDRANPVTYLPPNHFAPIFVLHGTRDGFVRFASARDFVEKLEKYQPADISFMVIKNGSHLDAVRWVYKNGKERQALLDWISSLDE